MTTKTKRYTSAPLPFQGQKRNWITDFSQAIKSCPSDAVYLDVFGGSGILSNCVKNIHPSATVVYNDFDNYSHRLSLIPTTNKIINDIRKLDGLGEHNHRMSAEVKESILSIISNYDHDDVDFLTLSANLLFSLSYMRTFDEFKKPAFYNCIVKSDYNADGYLTGVKVESLDYRKLIEKYKSQNPIIIADPPYLSTEVGGYKDVNYWSLFDYLDVLTHVKQFPSIFFTSNKSHLIKLIQWLKINTNFSLADNHKIVERKANPAHNASYTDIMLLLGLGDYIK